MVTRAADRLEVGRSAFSVRWRGRGGGRRGGLGRPACRSALFRAGKFAEQQARRGDVGLVRLLRRGEAAEITSAPVLLDAGEPAPMPLAPKDALEAWFIVATSPSIRTILGASRRTQVVPAVICGIPVAVIYQSARPLACDVKPCEVVGGIRPPVDTDAAIVSAHCPSNSVDLKRFTDPLAPAKFPRLRIIAKYFVQPRVRDPRSFFHSRFPKKLGPRERPLTEWRGGWVRAKRRWAAWSRPPPRSRSVCSPPWRAPGSYWPCAASTPARAPSAPCGGAGASCHDAAVLRIASAAPGP